MLARLLLAPVFGAITGLMFSPFLAQLEPALSPTICAVLGALLFVPLVLSEKTAS